MSLILTIASIIIIRQNLLAERERLVAERVAINSTLVADKIGAADVDTQSLFGSLSTAGKPSVIVRSAKAGGDIPISLDTRYGAAVLPASLTARVLDQRVASTIRFERNGEILLAVGAPIPNSTGGYFEINQLGDINKSLSSLLVPLLAAAGVITAIGAGLGWWASRRVLRPLSDITQVAADVAQGRLDSRVAYSEWADDVDLAPLVSAFNDMVAAMQTRIDRDARFASDVSHELRSPLTTFNASLEVLRNGRDEMPERSQLALDLLSSDMERFTQLVEDLLEISRFDAGAVRLELDEVLIVESVEMASRTLSTTPITIESDPSLQGVIITLDKRRLMRVLANFIGNAAKYGDGARLITVMRATHPPIDAPDEEPMDWIQVGVADEGPGVPESERERIFDRFSRGEMGGRRGNDLGVGLGLALAAEHARLQGGSVWVENRNDVISGARFVVELPLIEADDEDSDTWDNDTLGLDEVLVGPSTSEVTSELPVISIAESDPGRAR